MTTPDPPPPPPTCPFDAVALHALDLECPQHVKGGGTCGAPLAYRFTWPGQKEQHACERHGKAAERIAQSMGFALELLPLYPVVDCNSPVAVCLEDAIETEAFELVRAELADFKRAIDTIAAILRPLPLDASRRVFVAAATAVGFPDELIAGFVRGIDIGIASMFYKPHGGSPS